MGEVTLQSLINTIQNLHVLTIGMLAHRCTWMLLPIQSLIYMHFQKLSDHFKL